MISHSTTLGLFARFGVLLLSTSIAFANPPQTFQQAKRVAKALFVSHRQTLYCHCQYDEHQQIDLASCQMQAASIKKRSLRVEFEHMTPAENFGRQFRCWREPLCTRHGKPYKGRACCARSDSRFKQAEAELYNLYPAEGIVNQARSNYRYGLVDGTDTFYGCAIRIDKATRTAEPDDSVKGLVARATLFMSQQYQIKLSKSQRQLLVAWDRRFPPDVWEKEWASHIAAIEGYENPFITQRLAANR